MFTVTIIVIVIMVKIAKTIALVPNILSESVDSAIWKWKPCPNHPKGHIVHSTVLYYLKEHIYRAATHLKTFHKGKMQLLWKCMFEGLPPSSFDLPMEMKGFFPPKC